MARTKKAERLYEAKRDGLRYSIRVLQAAEELVNNPARTPLEHEALKVELASKHDVKAYDITQALLRY